MIDHTDASSSILETEQAFLYIAQTDHENDEMNGLPLPDRNDDEKMEVVAARIMKKYKPAFEKLAK